MTVTAILLHKQEYIADTSDLSVNIIIEQYVAVQ